MSARRLQKFRSVLHQRQPDLTVIMENVHKPHNLAAVLRTCDAIGVFKAHAVCTQRGIRTSVNAAQGAHRWVPVITHTHLDEAITVARDQSMQIIAAHPTPGGVDFRDIDYTRPTALLLGAELEGLTEAALAAADKHVNIPMHGMATSLNVSVAAALVLYEAESQRRRAGLYDHPQLQPSVIRHLLFEWVQPRMARYCRQNGLPYPELDEGGDLLHHPADGALSK